jgi:hypothetical protein
MALLVLPNFVMILGLEDVPKNKNRRFYTLPDFNTSTLLKSISDYKEYYQENYGLKTAFVNTYINIKTSILHEGPIPDKVIKGQDGWYFLGNHSNNVINDSFGNAPFTPEELEIITKYLSAINTYLVSRKINFYLVVPSNKSQIYKEKLPFQLSQNTSRLNQLKSHLKKEINLDIIDLGPELKSKKSNQPLYLKTDTHWNELGAFIGYSKVINNINTDHYSIPLEHISDYKINYKFDTGDITALLNDNTLERSISFEKQVKSPIIEMNHSYDYQHYFNPSGKKKLIMYRDSFSIAWIPYFVESFEESIYLTNYNIDGAFIEKVKPDIVIYEIVERNLGSVLLNIKKGVPN